MTASEKVSSVLYSLEWVVQGSGYGFRPAAVLEAFGQHCDALICRFDFFGCSCMEPGVGLDYPCRSLPAWGIL